MAPPWQQVAAGKLRFASARVGWHSWRSFMQQVNLGIIGAGTVGGGVYQAIQRNGGLMASRLGVRLEIVKIAARDLKKPRPVSIPKGLLTNDWRSVVDDPRVQIIVELMGGTTTAREVE